ncbi:MAG TPA: hypothetical protein VFC00_36730 [Micromonosporaceae bacterium]|nr:hypothetical protein [Micromonosporaceae bacterium]
MGTRVSKLLLGLIVTPMLVAVIWPATQTSVVAGGTINPNCPTGSTWESCH